VFQFDLTVQHDGGSLTSVTFSDTVPEDVSGIGPLRAWVREECGRIWHVRITKKKS
jgi:hypothetical protein